MKRAVLFMTVLAMALLVSAPVVAQPTPSVPYLINFQGKLTTPVGTPVPDGAHTFIFRMFDGPGGGALLLWTEGPLGIVTTGGLFTHQLGSLTALPIPLPGRIFSDNDQVWLEVEADGAVITPRTRLTSNTYSQVANFVETDPAAVGIVTVRIPTPGTDCHISTYGFAGAEKSRIGNCSYGEFTLWDFTPTQTVTLTANPGVGGEMRLTNPGGATTIDLHGGMLGDASAVFPTDAINSIEMLDEPGVSNSIRSPFFFSFTTGNITYVIDSVDITIPAAGYVEVTCGGYLNLFHTVGTTTEVWFGSNSVRGSQSFTTPGTQVSSIPSGQASALWQQPAISSRLYVQGAPGTYRYYVQAVYSSGPSASTNVAGAYIRATYYPSLYGTTTLATVAGGVTPATSTAASDGSGPVSNLELTTITLDEHKAQVAAKQTKQIAELEARIKQLENMAASLNKDKLGVDKR